MVSEEYIEAVLIPSVPDASRRVEDWLVSRRLRLMPLFEGRLLVQGDRQTFDTAFGVDLRSMGLPATLPVPAELRDLVTSITVPSPRHYH